MGGAMQMKHGDGTRLRVESGLVPESYFGLPNRARSRDTSGFYTLAAHEEFRSPRQRRRES